MKKIAVPSEDRSNVNKENLLFFNQIFDKKRLKALISWVFKQSGEAEALRVIDILKETGFKQATKAGISIGLHDLATPIQKAVLISESQLAIATTDRDFSGAKITATERSQRIIDTWHRASESLSKQVVDYFAIYDRFNPVYIMALSGARGNFSQVRQLIGMRGLMADQQGKIVNFPIQSNLREGLTLTEYFISCSGARKGLVDTALRTADTGYLTRRLVDVSHHVVVKKLRCNTNRAIAFRSLQSYNKVLLPLKERLVGRVLSEDIYLSDDRSLLSPFCETKSPFFLCFQSSYKAELCIPPLWKQSFQGSKKLDFFCFRSPSLLSRSESHFRYAKAPEVLHRRSTGSKAPKVIKSYFRIAKATEMLQNKSPCPQREIKLKLPPKNKTWNRLLYTNRTAIAKQDQEISLKLALKITKVREQVYLRSPLTCGFTHSVCQLCYGWSISQGSLVSLGDAVGVIAAQSIGEPGTQLTMRTFHTGGVFSGDLLQEIRAPHAGKITFSKAFGGLLIRTAHGHLAFLSKIEGSLYISNDEISNDEPLLNPHKTVIPIPAFSLLFIRQGEKVSTNQLLAEFSIRTKEGAQPIKTQQTIFAELSGIILEDCSGKVYTKKVKESDLLLDFLDPQSASSESSYLDLPKVASVGVSQNLPMTFKKGGSSSICKAQTHANEDIENDLFSYIEPVQSGRLGFLKILSTRVGATLDYSYPIKSIDYPFVKKNKIHELKKDCYFTNLDLRNSKLFRLHLGPYVPFDFVSPKGHVLSLQTKEIKQSLQVHTKLCFVRSTSKANQLLQPPPENQPALFKEEGSQNLETSPLKNKTLQFYLSTAESKYLHPESIKENRFLLHTIAEYGDIVDETYKKKVFNL